LPQKVFILEQIKDFYGPLSKSALTFMVHFTIFGSLPFGVSKNEGEGPGTAAATVEGLAFSNRP